MEPTVILRNLTTGYPQRKGQKVISHALSGELHEGELTCLLGPNGAGKSTLLRTIAGFQQPLEGEVLVDSQRVGNYSPKDLARKVSIVLTKSDIARSVSARQVVETGRSPYTGFWGKLQEHDRKVVDKCFDWLGISDLKDRKMETLSDGEQQKVMIAKAIAQQTPIILLDEPTAYLDYPSKISMLMMLHRLAKALHKTIFLSTHDLEHALQVADQVWLLDPQLGLTCGMPEDLSVKGHIARYFQRPGISFDQRTLALNIEHETSREILFQGNAETLEYQLAERAFQRNGIRPIRSMSEAKLESTIDTAAVNIPGDGTYRMLSHGEETACAITIEQILHIATATVMSNKIQDIRDQAQMTAFE